MILIYILFAIAIVAATLWGFNTFLAHQDTIIIFWAGQNYEISPAKLLAAALIIFLLFYITLRLFKHLISLGKYIKNYRIKSHHKKTQKGLMHGLISLVEGDWEIAKSQLLAHVAHAEIPVLHYLGAAKAAHMNESYAQRDQYLKLANEVSKDANIAIAISQAEMQLAAQQLEQARAGLVTLLDEHPKHSYAKKLLARAYYKQEDWKKLSAMLPDLHKQKILNERESTIYESASIKGIFQMYAIEENLPKLKVEWKKLPATIRSKPTAILLYCKALIVAGDNTTANKLIISSLNKQWDDELVECFGKSDHDNVNHAIKQAEKWLPSHDKSPVFLLSLARLYRKNQLWGKARNFFESSLNQAPNAQGYLEFAELLEETQEQENAELCYKAGLYFCIHKKGQPLTLRNRRDTNKKSLPALEAEVLTPPASDYPITSR